MFCGTNGHSCAPSCRPNEPFERAEPIGEQPDRDVIGMSERRELVLMERGQSAAPPGMREFSYTTRALGTRYDLTVATWADGSRAFLDSRGLLHLKSSDPAVPEMTFVLSSEKLAGWSSEGTVFGPPYFIGDATATDAAYFEEAIRRFTGRLR